jgi:protein AroM
MRKVSDSKIAAIITMGQSGSKTHDVKAALSNAVVREYGILDGMTLEDVKRDAWPGEDENFIVTNMADGTNVRVSEKQAIERVNECLSRAEADGAAAALILCTGHFELFETKMTVLVPERIILYRYTSLHDSLILALLCHFDSVFSAISHRGIFRGSP